MATSLLDDLKGLMTPELLSTAGRSLGASETSVATGLGAAFPTILAGLAGKAGNAQAMRPFYDLINSPAVVIDVRLEPLLALERLDLLHGDLELVGDPRVGTALSDPATDLVEVRSQ